MRPRRGLAQLWCWGEAPVVGFLFKVLWEVSQEGRGQEQAGGS